ncbi:MAG TPA: hypothetical protein VJY35_04625 [Candidatus Eisenbacteria bacterium]|nr:hypothetical protein [Candidatus Eisenbacteria bacterium]
MTAERSRLAIAAIILLSFALASGIPAVARAQSIKPWVPPSADSLLQWSSDAKVRFQANKGDSVGGENFRAYELVGLMGRRLVRSLGKAGLLQAHAVEMVVDSLGLDVDVEVDPSMPQFVVMMVRNPYRLTANAVGFIYWYRNDDLRMQGSMFLGGHRPSVRVWWTGYPDQPYTMGVVDQDRSTSGRMHVTVFRMGPTAAAWSMIQSPMSGPQLEGTGEASWADVNADGRPELVAWVRGENDSLFESCPSCPSIIHEHTYTESRAGFRLHDLRILPSPYATFTLFVRLLAEGNRAAAARLLAKPATIDEAVAEGWGARRRAKAWVLEYGEEERWPRWLAFLHHGPRGDQRYIVHFELKEGRWIIREWLKPRRPARPGANPADSTAAGGKDRAPRGAP